MWDKNIAQWQQIEAANKAQNDQESDFMKRLEKLG